MVDWGGTTGQGMTLIFRWVGLLQAFIKIIKPLLSCGHLEAHVAASKGVWNKYMHTDLCYTLFLASLLLCHVFVGPISYTKSIAIKLSHFHSPYLAQSIYFDCSWLNVYYWNLRRFYDERINLFIILFIYVIKSD